MLHNFFVIILGVFIASGASVCPDGYCRHSDGCFRTVGLNVTWIDAKSYCTVLGGVLLSPTSSASQATAEGALRRSKDAIHPGKYWLDITDLLNPSEWKTMSDTQALVYNNWASSSHTNEDNTKNCVYMSLENDFKWAIASCSEKMNFVCFHAGLPPTTERVFVRSTRVYRNNRRKWESVYETKVLDDSDVDC
ncbi:perlucin-like protein [Mya arenaria]|uniref:perlucin-like protein n=1 Tax=Mya arenaria TaxID=6604 RepID=UPI0022E5E3A1|nr:perlucin-like protein [Mya arenaria]